VTRLWMASTLQLHRLGSAAPKNRRSQRRGQVRFSQIAVRRLACVVSNRKGKSTVRDNHYN
jgi:hypothetical protein